MRILHLAYEDPRQPGSGGGSVRTREINRRLAQRHEITALVAGYPGARPRVEDDVRWVPISPGTGTKVDRLAYFAALGPAIRHHPHDLVVEDFGAPFSVGFAPRWTSKPVVASVQWLFATEMRDKYGLPFDMVERAGLPHYRRFIAVSDWLAGMLRARQPGASVRTIPNGVDDLAFATPWAPPRQLLFIGRLDTMQKGCDLLLQSMALIKQQLGEATPPLLVLGSGPDRAALEQQAAQLGLGEHVRFLGHVDGAAKYELMAQSYAVLMPSRFETFGMVAIEAQAAGAPVVAFDIGPLREVAGGGGAVLVPPFEVAAFAEAVVACIQAPRLLERLRLLGRQWARRYRWDDLADQQEAFYLQVLAASSCARSA